MTNIKNNLPNPNSGYRQGYFIPQRPEKYIGDPTKIIYRSSWERKFMTICDTSPLVETWSSEPMKIPYISPLDGKVHNYFVDFFCSLKLNEENTKKYLIEIKPKNQAVFEKKEPKSFKSIEKYRAHLETVAVNLAKWKAAETFATSMGWEFKVWTEENLGIQ